MASTTWAQEAIPQLQWGPHSVGFQSQIEIDASRLYVASDNLGCQYGRKEKRGRPILINQWYPADVDEAALPMTHGEYFEIPATDEVTRRWAEGLVAFAKGVVVTEIFEKSEDELNAGEQQLLQRLLESPTRAFRNANSVTGTPFPVIVFHSGAGSSYEDNARFCEYLASWGFVVLGSAYPEADGSAFHIDGGEGSIRDMGFLVGFARNLEYADWSRIGYAGHSAGAQACLRACTRPDCPAQVCLLLDTTVDYYGLAVPNFDSLTRPVLENRHHIRQPLLVCASPDATFEMCDALIHADRSYFTVPVLGHNEFIQQGLLKLQVQAWLRALPTDDPDAKAALEEAVARTADVERFHAELCLVAREFLTAHLRTSDILSLPDRPNASSALFQVNGYEFIGDAPSRLASHLSSVPAGTAGPDHYNLECDEPPTPRQFVTLARTQDISTANRTLRRFQDQAATSPLYDNNMMIGSLLFELAETNRINEARQLVATAEELNGNPMETLRFLAFFAKLSKRPEAERRMLAAVLKIDPDDEKAQTMWKDLVEREKE